MAVCGAAAAERRSRAAVRRLFIVVVIMLLNGCVLALLEPLSLYLLASFQCCHHFWVRAFVLCFEDHVLRASVTYLTPNKAFNTRNGHLALHQPSAPSLRWASCRPRPGPRTKYHARGWGSESRIKRTEQSSRHHFGHNPPFQDGDDDHEKIRSSWQPLCHHIILPTTCLYSRHHSPCGGNYKRRHTAAAE